MSEVGVCVYCLRFTTRVEPSACSDVHGHDYSYDEEYVAQARSYLENLKAEVLPL